MDCRRRGGSWRKQLFNQFVDRPWSAWKLTPQASAHLQAQDGAHLLALINRATGPGGDRTGGMAKWNPPESQWGMDAKVSQLRKLLLTAKELDQVSEYFHHVLVPDESFMASGVPSFNPRVLMGLQAALKVVAPEGKLGASFMIRLQQQAFCHGYSTWGRGHAVFLYFEQLDLGFCSYARSLSSAEVTFLRFNLRSAAGVDTWATANSQRGSA